MNSVEAQVITMSTVTTTPVEAQDITMSYVTSKPVEAQVITLSSVTTTPIKAQDITMSFVTRGTSVEDLSNRISYPGASYDEGFALYSTAESFMFGFLNEFPEATHIFPVQCGLYVDEHSPLSPTRMKTTSAIPK